MPAHRATLALLLGSVLALTACSPASGLEQRPSTAHRPITSAKTMTVAKLRAFVLHGTTVKAKHYARSAQRPNAPLRHNRFGDLTFETPSGNISCDLRPAATATAPISLCWVQQLAHRVARPRSCSYEWVPGLVMLTRGAVQVGSCRGDEPFARYATVLTYGHTLFDRASHSACRSDERYVACVSLDRPHGFLADRDRITVVGH